MSIETAIQLLVSNGYTVIKKRNPLSLKSYWEQHQGEKINFVCFKSRLRWAGILKTWRDAGDISRAFNPEDLRQSRRQEDIKCKIHILNNL